MTARYGCWGRATFAPYYLPTGAPDEAQYRIPHVFTRTCQYRHTALGQADAKCGGCKHKISTKERYMTTRLNLKDQVLDLAPPPPPCFLNRDSWREYLTSAAAAQSTRGEPKVIIIVNGEPAFAYDYPICADCTQVKSVEMLVQGRCDPKFLVRLGEKLNKKGAA